MSPWTKSHLTRKKHIFLLTNYKTRSGHIVMLTLFMANFYHPMISHWWVIVIPRFYVSKNMGQREQSKVLILNWSASPHLHTGQGEHHGSNPGVTPVADWHVQLPKLHLGRVIQVGKFPNWSFELVCFVVVSSWCSLAGQTEYHNRGLTFKMNYN